MILWIYLNLAFYPFYHCTSKHLAKNVIAFEATETYKNHHHINVYMFIWHGHHPAASSRVWLQAGLCAVFQAMLHPVFIWGLFGAFHKIMKIRTNTRGWSMRWMLWGCQRCSELTWIVPVEQQLKGDEGWVMNFLSNIFAMWACNMALPLVRILQLYF